MYQIYKIEPGDTLEIMAMKTNSSVDELIDINGLDENYMVIPGNLIIVPKRTNEILSPYIAKKGDTIYSIAKQFNVRPQEILLMNGLEVDDYIYPNQRILIPTNGMETYVTKENDTINDLLSQFTIDFEELLALNESIYLMPNQLLIVKKD